MPEPGIICALCRQHMMPPHTPLLVVQTVLAVNNLPRHIQFQCTRDQIRFLKLCQDCFDALEPLPAPGQPK